MKILPPEEYYASLPKKQMGSGILLFNKNNELLLVKPTYKDKWSIPGGSVDAEESPRNCTIRETKEETGLDLEEARLVCIDYKKSEGVKIENLQFIFYGGKLSDEKIKEIKLEKDELEGFKFVPIDEALKIARPNLAKRLPHCLEAIKAGRAVYLEEGEKI